jgi:hypothetical protein
MYDEWVTKRTREPMKWFGTALFLFGSVIVSAFPAFTNAWWPFMAFLAGHCLWVVAGISMRDSAIITLNALYVPLDVFAIFIRLS